MTSITKFTGHVAHVEETTSSEETLREPTYYRREDDIKILLKEIF